MFPFPEASERDDQQIYRAGFTKPSPGLSVVPCQLEKSKLHKWGRNLWMYLLFVAVANHACRQNYSEKVLTPYSMAEHQQPSQCKNISISCNGCEQHSQKPGRSELRINQAGVWARVSSVSSVKNVNSVSSVRNINSVSSVSSVRNMSSVSSVSSSPAAQLIHSTANAGTLHQGQHSE